MQKVAVITYVHKLSHNLKKVAQRYDVKVVFTAPHRLSKLCRMTDPEARKQQVCGTEHRRPFVECAEGVVYKIALKCAKVYVGQTGRCVNDRLREHANNVKNARDGKDVKGFLASHCITCQDCAPELNNASVIKKSKTRITREIIQGERISYLGDNSSWRS